jgi:hypothetical protein
MISLSRRFRVGVETSRMVFIGEPSWKGGRTNSFATGRGWARAVLCRLSPRTSRASPIIPEGHPARQGKWQNLMRGIRVQTYSAIAASITKHSPSSHLARRPLTPVGQGSRIFAISPACCWRRRIAHSQWTLLQSQSFRHKITIEAIHVDRRGKTARNVTGT